MPLRRLLLALRRWLPAALVVLASCGGKSEKPPIPRLVYGGAPYFSIGGDEQFLASRNIAGRSVEEIETLLDQARDQGTKLVRFHVTHLGGLGITSSGDVVESWAAAWDRVFARAEADGIYVIPVFGVWADWNDGSAMEPWHVWDQNPLNGANGGPAASPVELYQAGSAGQEAWLGWLGKLVARWQRHRNVGAWEVFSELDLVTHTGLDEAAFQAAAVSFVEAAAPVIRAGDPLGRPVTASLAWWPRFSPALYQSSAIDLVQLHLYGADLDTMILDAVASVRALVLPKPVLLGESGLDAAAPDGTTATTAPEGPRATRHAAWAALVSGAMNGRALWWEDGYDILQNGDAAAVAFVTGYPAVEAPVLSLLGGRDMARMQPLGVTAGPALVGGALGNEGAALGWFRSAGCAPPGWDCSTEPAGQLVTLEMLGTAGHWLATFRDAVSGTALCDPVALTPDDAGRVTLTLPQFTDGVAFELRPVP